MKLITAGVERSAIELILSYARYRRISYQAAGMMLVIMSDKFHALNVRCI